MSFSRLLSLVLLLSFSNDGSSFQSSLLTPSRSQHPLDGQLSRRNRSYSTVYAKKGGFGGGAATKKKKKNKTKKTIVGRTNSQNVMAPQPSKTSTTTVHRKDYREPAHWVTNALLDFNIVSDDKVVVTSTLTVQPNPSSLLNDLDFVLNGDGNVIALKQLSILLTKPTDDTGTAENSQQQQLDLVKGTDYELSSNELRVKADALLKHKRSDGTTIIKAVVELENFDEKRSELSGLYRRDGMFVTHCEPTGFRQITYFPDRPDNTAIFKVRIEAPKQSYPLLLSNGNCIESGDVVTNSDCARHYAVFYDPHPKPCYIFGLIAAGPLASLSDTYTTASGKKIALQIYTSEAHSISRLQFALDTLKRSMAWDEETYGLEYDLDVYNIVAAQHFVLGAMENKGLNLFQTSLIATDPQCTTDVTYDLVEKTVAHEYFHNWSGNRVTVRDWFEFSLKEGLTVYRDQEFTADIGLRTITRIEAVKILREKQFREDASDDRHPIRPESASASREHTLDALASSTTYHKGAEVCRMYKSILGKDGFRNGLRLYMDRHDGTAATCDDFRNAMADANQEDFDQFALWYSTAGTPTVSYKYSHDNDLQTFSLTLTQSLEHNPDVLLHIPVAVGFLDKVTGEELVPTTTLELKERTQTFEFPGLDKNAIPSILRDFSAPVIVVSENTADQDNDMLTYLATYDTDGFNRWEAIQQLYSLFIFGIMRGEDVSNIKGTVFKAFGHTLKETGIDPASKSYLLNLPTESILSRQLDVENPGGVHNARKELGRLIHDEFRFEIRELYDELSVMSQDGGVRTDTMSRATRALRNILLDYLCFVNPDEEDAAGNIAMTHLDTATCLTDRLTAFRKLSSMSGVARYEATEKFYQYAKQKDPIVMHKWFQTQALADEPDVLDRVKTLTQHPDFKATNAGRFRSLITSFTMNSNAFHCESGAGYKFIGSVITQMDAVAPQLAIELANKLTPWKRHDSVRSSLMKAELERIAASKKLSRGLALTVNRALAAD